MLCCQAADLTRPIEKKTYRGPSPTCHDFNQFTAKSDRLMLIIGFTLGQIQLVEPMLKEYNKLFNEEVLAFHTFYSCSCGLLKVIGCRHLGINAGLSCVIVLAIVLLYNYPVEMGRMSDYDIRRKPKVWASSPNEYRTFGRTSAECCVLG